MTMQSPNFVLYQGEKWIVLDASRLIFHPRQFGIYPIGVSTGLRRGYLCTFEITDDTLILDSLMIEEPSDWCPAINGVKPSRTSDYSSTAASYDSLDLRIDYTGTLRFGTDRDVTYRVTMLGHEAWMFRQVREATIVDGHVESISDLSEEMARIRAEQPESATVKGSNESLRQSIADLDRFFAERRRRKD